MLGEKNYLNEPRKRKREGAAAYLKERVKKLEREVEEEIGTTGIHDQNRQRDTEWHKSRIQNAPRNYWRKISLNRPE